MPARVFFEPEKRSSDQGCLPFDPGVISLATLPFNLLTGEEKKHHSLDDFFSLSP